MNRTFALTTELTRSVATSFFLLCTITGASVAAQNPGKTTASSYSPEKLAALTPSGENPSAARALPRKSAAASPAKADYNRVAIALRKTLTSAQAGSVGASTPAAVRQLYQRNRFTPLWVDANGMNAQGYEAVATLRLASSWGLLQDYGRYLRAPSTASGTEGMARFDLQLSTAVLQMLQHLANGQLNPENPELNWNLLRSEVADHELITKLLSGEALPVIAEQLVERKKEQAGLLEALADYDTIVAEGGWPQLTGRRLLKQGNSSDDITLLRERLAIEGYPIARTTKPRLFDKQLFERVKEFQARHGLRPDGSIGKQTRLALNISAETRRDQIHANLERLRWMPENLGRTHVRVNIPDYRLQLITEDKPELDMAVVVGRKKRETPVFSGDISILEVNPVWNVPVTIAFEDYLPKLKKDPYYLKNKRIRVFQNWKASAKELDPGKVDWSAVVDGKKVGKRRWFPYRLTQDPGRNNSLGRVKFLFPNSHNVYLHDTPERGLFRRTARAYSSGCIRVEDPEALADYLLNNHQSKAIDYRKTLRRKRTRRLYLDDDVPVHILYLTSWVDQFGVLQFREDIYGHDRPLVQMLNDLKPEPRSVRKKAPPRRPPITRQLRSVGAPTKEPAKDSRPTPAPNTTKAPDNKAGQPTARNPSTPSPTT